MARINLPFADAPVAAQNGPAYDQQAITQMAATTAQENEQLLGQAVHTADTFRQKAEKADMAKVEAENAASMGQLLAFGAKNIGNALQDATQKLIQIDHQETMLRQDRETDVFLLEAGTKLKEDMIYRLDGMKGGRAGRAGPSGFPFDAKGNPTGNPMVPVKGGGRTAGTGMKYTAGDGPVSERIPQPTGAAEAAIEGADDQPTGSPTGLHSGVNSTRGAPSPVAEMAWFNKRIQADIAQAPNEKAKFAYMKMASELKLNLLSHSLAERRRAAASSQVTALQSTIKSLGKQLQADPYNGPMPYLQTLNKIGEAVKMNGYSDANLGPFMNQAKSYLYGRQVQGFINQGDPQTAFQKLASADFKEVMSGKDYAAGSYNTAKELLSIDLARNTAVKTALGINGIEQGSFLPGMPGVGKYADLHFEGYMSQTLPNSQASDKSNYRDITNAMLPYWKNYQIVGHDQAAFLSSKINNSPNAYEVAGYSLGLYRMMKDPLINGEYRSVANQFYKADPKTVQQAVFIGQQVEAGVPVEQAVSTVRDVFDAKNSTLIEHREKQYEELLKGNEVSDYKFDSSKLVKEALGVHFWNADPVNMTQMQLDASDAFKYNFLKTGDGKAAAKLATLNLSTKYAVTNVNGKPMAMEAAPEMFYKGKDLVEFNQSLDAQIKTSFTKLGYEVSGREVIKDGKSDRILVQSIGNGYTANKDSNNPYDHTYVLTYESTGRPITVDLGNGYPEVLSYNMAFNHQEYVDNINNLHQELVTRASEDPKKSTEWKKNARIVVDTLAEKNNNDPYVQQTRSKLYREFDLEGE